MDGELESAIQRDDLPKVKLVVKGGASIAAGPGYSSALMLATVQGHISIIEWLLTEGGAIISEVDVFGDTALLRAAGCNGNFGTVQWLLEHGGADIKDTTSAGGHTVWDMLDEHFVGVDEFWHTSSEVTALLRVMVLQDDPPDSVVATLPEHKLVMQEGARLRAGLPTYLAQRRVLLDLHCPLLEPLRSIVHGYEEPTTTEELWATGIGAAPRCERRPRDGVALPLMRRSERVRQRRNK
jgi:hypothetical protein